MSWRGLLKTLAALCGLALFIWMLSRFDLAAIYQQTLSVGLPGFIAIVVIYGFEFLCDVAAWQLTLPHLEHRKGWLLRLLRVRLVGEAINTLTPLGGMGGEPVKALLLKKHYQVDYPQSASSLVLSKTFNVFALVVFLAIGFFWMLDDDRITSQLQWMAALGLGVLSIGITGFFLLQHLSISSRGMRKLASHRGHIIERLHEFDEQLIQFYRQHRLRCLSTLLLGILNWVIGAFGVMVTLHLMGYPLSFRDAWIIEAMAQMVRAAIFFVPASIGLQEGVYVILVGALSGNPALGLAAALVRRGREIVWIAFGLALGWRYLHSSRAGAVKE